MNLPHDPQIAAWLAAGSAEGPPEPLSRALAATRQTRKRPRWTFPERWLPVQLTMTRTRPQRPFLAIVWLALLMLALVVTALYIGSRQAEPPPVFRNGAVVYSQDGDMFIADELGGTPRPLVAGPEYDSMPAFSAQGDRIAFVRSEEEDSHATTLMTVRPDGSGLTELAKPGHVTSFDWSPDGGALLVSAHDGGSGFPVELQVIQSDGSGSRTLDIMEGRPASASWRPDGRHIVFVSERFQTAHIADADGANARELPVGTDGLAWSPDGTHLSFLSAPGNTDQVNIADIAEDGTVSDVRQLILDAGSAPRTDPKWSPDGSQLAFVLRVDDALRVGLADADGSGYRLVGTGVHDDRWAIDLTWAPDGRSVVVFEREAPDAMAWSVDVTTGLQTGLQTPVWSWQRLAP